MTATMMDLAETRKNARRGDALDQDEIDAFAARFADLGQRLRPREKQEEFLALVDADGVPNGKVAPRWLCHLLMLRHRAVHVLLTTDFSSRRCVVLQLRAPTKAEFPLHFDISAAGHVQSHQIADTRAAAYDELYEELGIKSGDLETELQVVTAYLDENVDAESHLYNAEFKELYVGHIEYSQLARCLVLDPDEVAGLAFIPEENLAAFLTAESPVADALRSSGRYYTGIV